MKLLIMNLFFVTGITRHFYAAMFAMLLFLLPFSNLFADTVVNDNHSRSVEPDFVAEIGIKAIKSTIMVDSTATFSLFLQPGTSDDTPVDLWLLAVRGESLYYFDLLSMKFVSGLNPTYQGKLLALDNVQIPVFYTRTGDYTIYFGVDTIANGRLDFGPGELFFSSTSLKVNAYSGHFITYLYNGEVYRVEAVQGASPENISKKLDASASGEENSINVSPNGDWYLISTDRFHDDCAGWPCLALSDNDFSNPEVIIADGSVVHNEGASAVDSSGKRVVFSLGSDYPGEDGHIRDLWLVEREGTNWSAPFMITVDSPFLYNNVPAVSQDGAKVLFECGNEPYENKSICEVSLDGSGFRVIFAPDKEYLAARTPDYSPDGTVVAELDSVEYGESIFRISPVTGQISPINLEFSNDNSPCVLGDGRIASLWLNREGSDGIHELKIMEKDGTKYFMLLTDTDIIDEILGCSSW
ncbi:exported hypothetical protein [Desulfamplus magnetovallimortis]|uniref:WD40 domain protein beta Propeller n=1 Tax=Desulfamplus magnetovallimortis TaxID=1246637 RepID=A0A1W1HHB3_9BACT|nr:hypothetical protein [Desulfamplus magnetovallimortis]SLM31768.1 exported hypothetical protein [Desulfamplus magnetovallimortis]